MNNIEKAIKKRKEFEANLITKALEDENFRNELVSNPKAVVEKEVGKPLPEGVEVKVVEEAPNTITIILPRIVSKPQSGELSDENLEKVAGGFSVGVFAAAVSEDGFAVYGVTDPD